MVLHDWWLYRVVTGCGGRVLYAPQPSLRYRQHDGNLVGGRVGWRARLGRIRVLLKGRFRHGNDRNLAALRLLRFRLTADNHAIFYYYVAAREQRLIPRLIGLRRSGIHRQSLLGNLGLVGGAVLKKM